MTPEIVAALSLPIEAGITHPAEALIEEALLAETRIGQFGVGAMCMAHQWASERPSRCATLIHCLGRIDYYLVDEWGPWLVGGLLFSSCDAEIRDAAIGACEQWGTPLAIAILRGHNDFILWLDDYAKQVIADHAEAV